MMAGYYAAARGGVHSAPAGQGMRESAMKRGRCLCGEVTFEYDGPENWVAHCHCESCRRATSSPFTTFFGVSRDAYRFTGAKPGLYESSPGVRRLFCSRCGSPIAYDSEKYADEIHFYAASLDDSRNLSPLGHVHWAERVPWIELGDALPKYEHGG
jgi:hypothetical protein